MTNDNVLEHMFKIMNPKMDYFELSQECILYARNIQATIERLIPEQREETEKLLFLLCESAKCASLMSALMERAIARGDEILFEAMEKANPVFSGKAQ